MYGVFIYDAQKAGGGWNDFVIAMESREGALAAAKNRANKQRDHAHVVSFVTMEVIARFKAETMPIGGCQA